MASSPARRERKLKEKLARKLEARVAHEAVRDPNWARRTQAARKLLEDALKDEHPTKELLKMQGSLDNLLKEKGLL